MERALLLVTDDLTLLYLGAAGPMLKAFPESLVGRSCTGVVPLLPWKQETFHLQIQDLKSSIASIKCWLPRGSVLGPILFSVYMLLRGMPFGN